MVIYTKKAKKCVGEIFEKTNGFKLFSKQL